jgi:RNA polymerase sigma-70 factor (ECF subfamily)
MSSSLFERLARGDKDAAGEVYRIYGPRVTAMARQYFGPFLRARMQTEDLTQQAWIDITQGAQRKRFRSERDFLTWVGVVVKNRVRSLARYWRAEKRRGAAPGQLESWRGDLVDPGASRPSEIVRSFECLDELCDAVAKLPEPEAEVFRARFFLEMPWKGIAQLLGVTENAVRLRFHRARERLMSRLGARDG